MKSISQILAALVLLCLLLGWKFYEDEVRTYLGIPLVSEEEEFTEDDREATAGRSKATATLGDPSDQANEESGMEELKAIELILSQRYPDIPPVAFSRGYPSLAEVPTGAFPERVQTNVSVNFSLKQESGILIASFVKAGGMVRPLEIQGDGESLKIASLANSELKNIIPVSQTDLLDQIREKYSQTHQRALQRLQEIRTADILVLKSSSKLFDQLKEDPTHWEAPDADGFQVPRVYLENYLNPETHRVTGFLSEGRTQVQTDNRSGNFSTIAVRIEGSDQGFGPYLWRARCVFQRARIVEWIGLPVSGP